MSLYKQYVEELTEDFILETEKGFLTYSIQPEHVYLKDIYVLPEYRRAQEAWKMIDEVVAIAKEKGIKRLLGSVIPTNKDATVSMKAHLAYGFKIDSCAVNFILMSKEI